jgi:putative transcriptional regulator
MQKTWSILFKKPENRLMRVYVRSGWRMLLVVSAALAIAAGAASPGLALQQAADDLTPGTFLIAPRKAADPSFAGTVVLLVRIDDSGALGLVINRPTDVMVSTVLPDYKSARHVKDPAFSGGPVQADALLALYRSARKPDEASLIFRDVYLVSPRAGLERVLQLKPDAHNLRIYLGYTGWGPGQLEHEMDLDVWRVLPADADSIFAADPSAVWQRLIERTELRFALMMRPR